MKVLIEASEAYRNLTGIGRFARAIIEHLPPDLDVIYSPPDFADRIHTHGKRTTMKRLKHFGQHIWLTQGQVARTIRSEKPDVVYTFNFPVPLLERTVPLVTTIHDLAYFDLPQQTDGFWGSYGRRTMPLFAHHADAIVTGSDTTRRQIIDRLHVPPERVFRVYHGVGPNKSGAHFRPVEDAETLDKLRRAYGLEPPFVLYVGAWHASKNLPVLLRAFAGVRRAELVLTGEPYTETQDEIPALAKKLGCRARFIGHVPDEALPTLYSLARAAVVPSLYEGFGLPVIEAMACGTPVVTSDIPVLREIADGNAPHFPTNDPDALRDILQRLIDDDEENERWRSAALTHAAQFTWPRAVAQLVDIWRHVAGLS